MSIAIPICFSCVWYFNGPKSAYHPKCLAFPEGIPEVVFYPDIDDFRPHLKYHEHTRPYPGDNGLTFQPRENILAAFDSYFLLPNVQDTPRKREVLARKQKEQRRELARHVVLVGGFLTAGVVVWKMVRYWQKS